MVALVPKATSRIMHNIVLRSMSLPHFVLLIFVSKVTTANG